MNFQIKTPVLVSPTSCCPPQSGRGERAGPGLRHADRHRKNHSPAASCPADLHQLTAANIRLNYVLFWEVLPEFLTLICQWQLPENWMLDDAGSAGSSDPSSLGVTRAKYPVQASRTNQLASVTAAAFCKPANQPNIVRHRGNKGMYCLAPMWQHCRKQQQYATIMFGI